MKKCVNCGLEYPDEQNFCGACGGKLVVPEPPAQRVCRNCGEPLDDITKFCTKCGTPVEQEKPSVCSGCGTPLEDGARFCVACGKPVESGAAPAAAPVAKSSKAGGKLTAAKAKVQAFEGSRHVIVNGIIAALSLVIILVALLCPVKLTVSAVSDFTTDGSAYNATAQEVDQSVWQIFGGYKYLNLDIKDAQDVKKIKEVAQDYEKAVAAAAVDFKLWYAKNSNATEEEQLDKMYELMAEHFSDVNYLGYWLAVTTVGALEMLENVDEGELNDYLITIESTATVALIFATVTAALQLGIAVVALVFLVFAIIGMVKKKDAPLFKSLTIPAILSGVGLLVMSVAPFCAPGGAVFALALITVLSYFVLGMAKAVLSGKQAMFVVKRAICSAFAIVAFFLLCSNLITVTVTQYAERAVIGTLHAPLGTAFESLLTVGLMGNYMGVEIVYSDLSIASTIVTLSCGALAVVVLYTATLFSLRALTNRTETARNFDVLGLIGAVALILLGILPAVFGAVDELPYVSGETLVLASQIDFVARVFVYLAIGFAVAGFVFGLIYRPKKKA